MPAHRQTTTVPHRDAVSNIFHLWIAEREPTPERELRRRLAAATRAGVEDPVIVEDLLDDRNSRIACVVPSGFTIDGVSESGRGEIRDACAEGGELLWQDGRIHIREHAGDRWWTVY